MIAISSLTLSPAAFTASLTEFSCKSERNQSLNISLLDGPPRLGQQASGSYGTGQNPLHFSDGSWIANGQNLSIFLVTPRAAQNQYSQLEAYLSQVNGNIYDGTYKVTFPFGDFEEGQMKCRKRLKKATIVEVI